MANTKTCTLIGSDKGGVGKSLIAQIMVIAHEQAQQPLKVIEIDHQRKLTSIFKDRVDLSLDAGVGIAEALKDRRAAETFYNGAYEMWASCDSVTDLGANVTTSLLSWIQHCDVTTIAAEDGIRFRFIAIATPDDQAIRSVTTAIEQARRTLGVDADLFIVLNDTAGTTGFAPYENTEAWRRMIALQTTHGARLVHLPYCNSAIMEWGRAWGLTIMQILEPASEVMDKIAAEAKWGRVERHSHVRSFLSWVSAVQEAMYPIFADPDDHAIAAE